MCELYRRSHEATASWARVGLFDSLQFQIRDAQGKLVETQDSYLPPSVVDWFGFAHLPWPSTPSNPDLRLPVQYEEQMFRENGAIRRAVPEGFFVTSAASANDAGVPFSEIAAAFRRTYLVP